MASNTIVGKFIVFSLLLSCSAAAELPLNVHPLADPSNSIRNGGLTGKWSMAEYGVVIEVEESLGGEFKVAFSFPIESGDEKRTAKKEFWARHFRIEKHDYIEITSYVVFNLDHPEAYDPLSVDGNLLFSLKVAKDSLEVKMLDAEKLLRVNGAESKPLEVLRHKGRQLIVTSKAEAYRTFLAKNHKEIFHDKVLTLKRER